MPKKRRVKPFEIKKDNKGQYYGLVTASNGNALYKSTESYFNRHDLIQATLSAAEILEDFRQQYELELEKLYKTEGEN